MRRYEPARSRDALRARVRRLLGLDHESSWQKDEFRERILPFLESLGRAVLIGGAIRDVARAGKRGFSSDLDFVVHGGPRDDVIARVEARGGERNRFGGYALRCFQLRVDVWHIEDTWARTAGHVDVTEPGDLLDCTFFDWDSVIYEIDSGRLLAPGDYLERLALNVMDIRLEQNPNPMGSVVRALRRAALWHVQFGPRLTAFSQRCLDEMDWDDLVSLDRRAFTWPVLGRLDRGRLLDQLNAPVSCPVGDVTLPVPPAQLALPFDPVPR